MFEQIDYEATIQKWAEQLVDMQEWTNRPGEIAKNLYPILGLPRTSHMDYLNKITEAPNYVKAHIDTLNKLDTGTFFPIVINRMFPSGFKKKSAEELAVMTIQLWESIFDKKITEQVGIESAGEWSLRAINKRLLALQENDPSGVSTMLAIGDEINEIPSTGRYASATRKIGFYKIKFILEQPVVCNFITDQASHLISLVSKFKPDLSEQNIKWIKSYPIEVVNYSLNTFNSLKKVQASTGLNSDEQPVFSKLVFMFNNTRDLKEKMNQLPNGMALCIIRNTNPADSIFVIAVKRGQNLFLLSDQPNYPHPLKAGAMASRNNRYNAERMEGSLLPYEMLNLVWSDGARRVEESSISTAMIKADEKLKVVGSIDQMRIDTILWFGLTCDLCIERYFKNKTTEPMLGIVDNVQIKANFLTYGSAKTDLVVVNESNTLVVKTSKELDRKEFEKSFPTVKKRFHLNGWMQKKYADQVDSNLLYAPQVQADEKHLLGVKEMKGTEIITMYDSYNAKKHISLRSVDNKTLATVDEFQGNNDFIARVNQSKMIEQLALRDFKDNKDKILKWFSKAAVKNIPNLIDDLTSLNHERFDISKIVRSSEGCGLIPRSIFRMIHLAEAPQHSRFIWSKDTKNKPSVFLEALKLYSKREGRTSCYFDKELDIEQDDAELRLYLNISNAYDISIVTGIPVDKLPLELQTYGLTEGNLHSYMDSFVDPLDTIQNPWDNLKLRFSLPVSKKGLNIKRKALGLKPIYLSKLPLSNWEDGAENDEAIEKVYQVQKAFGFNVSPCLGVNKQKPSFSFYM